MKKKLEIIKNLFSNEDIAIIKDYCEEFKDDNMEGVATDRWDKRLTIGRGDIKLMTIDPTLDNDIYSIVHDTMLEKFKMKPKAVWFHFYQPEAFINWHNDGYADGKGHRGGATVYLNQNWYRDDGGLFLYEDDDNNIQGVVPEFNKCIFQQGGVWHSTSPTHWKSPVRKSLQVFF